LSRRESLKKAVCADGLPGGQHASNCQDPRGHKGADVRGPDVLITAQTTVMGCKYHKQRPRAKFVAEIAPYKKYCATLSIDVNYVVYPGESKIGDL
jgi:hypothetical protein